MTPFLSVWSEQQSDGTWIVKLAIIHQVRGNKVLLRSEPISEVDAHNRMQVINAFIQLESTEP